MKIRELGDKIMQLYGAKEFAEALKLLEESRKNYPGEMTVIRYWSACFLSLLGRKNEAMDQLEAVLAEGKSMPPSILLEEEDFEALRTTDRFAALINRNQELRKAARHQYVAVGETAAFSHPEATYDIVYLHGNNRSGEMEKALFEGYKNLRENFIFLNAPEPGLFADAHVWDYEADSLQYVEEIAAELMKRETGRGLILSGFSKGGRTALKAVLEKGMETQGVIAYAPAYLNDLDQWRILDSALKTPIILIVGDQDPLSTEGVLKLHRRLRDKGGKSQLYVIHGQGHTYPEIFDEYYTSALNHIRETAGLV